MATITAGPLPTAAAAAGRLQLDGVGRSRRNHPKLSFPSRNCRELWSRSNAPLQGVPILVRDFPRYFGARCSSCTDSARRGEGSIHSSTSGNADALKKFGSSHFSNCGSINEGSNFNIAAGDRGFRVLPSQSAFAQNPSSMGMLMGSVLLALGFGALWFCKPAHAKNIVSPPPLNSPFKGEEFQISETEAEDKLDDVVVPEGQSGGEKESGGGGEFEPPFGEGSDLTSDPAEVLLRSYLAMNPSDKKALQALLFLRLKKGEVNAAVPVLKKLIELEPNNMEWKYIRAQADEYAGNLVQALQGFEEILKIKPFSARAWQGLAVIMHKTGDDEEALQMLDEAVKTAVDGGHKKESLNLRMLLGQLHTLQGDLEKAMELYKLVVEEDPQDYRPYLCQGLVYSIIGEEAEAEKYFRRYRKLCPEDLQQRGFLDELMLRAKSESKEVSERAKKEEELKKKGKKLPKVMRQPLASGGTPKDNQDAR